MSRGLFRIGLFAIGLTGVFATVSALADLHQSPVQVIDYVKYGQVVTEFNRRPELKAFSEFSTILYDHFVERPWGKDYFPEANKRLTAFKSSFCPQIDSVCKLPAKVGTVSEVLYLNSLMDRVPMVEGLKSALGATIPESAPFYLDKIQFLEMPPEPMMPPVYNILLSGVESTKTIGEAEIWGMKGRDLAIKKKEFVMVGDIVTYRKGYALDESTSFLSFTAKGAAILNADLLNFLGMKAASLWKFKMRKIFANPSAGSNTAMVNFEEYVFNRLFQRNIARFNHFHEMLTAKLKTMPPAKAEATLKRFEDERSRGDFAEEVYQHVTSELYERMLEKQAIYFLLAKNQRKGLNPKRQTWESLLAIQADVEPIFTLYSVSIEAVFPQGSVLSQFVNPPVAAAYLWEHLKAVLDDKEFIGRDGYRRYGRALAHPGMFENSFLKEHCPESLSYLTDPATGAIKDFAKLDESSQKQFWKLCLYKPDGAVRVIPLMRMSTALLLGLSDEDASSLAREIRQVRKSEFVK